MGVFTGLAMFVPYLGFGLGLLLALIAGLLQFEPVTALLMVVSDTFLEQVATDGARVRQYAPPIGGICRRGRRTQPLATIALAQDVGNA